MSGEPATPAAAPSDPQAQAPELQPGAQPAPADGGAAPKEGQTEPTTQDQQPQETEEQRNKSRERFDKRFSDLSKRAREAELRAARAEGALEAMRLQGPRPQAEPAPQPAQAEGPPNPNDAAKYPQGRFDPRYAADLAKHELREEMRADEAKRAEATRKAESEAALQAGAERFYSTVDAARDAANGENGDFYQNAPRVLEEAARVLPPAYCDLIAQAENPVEVAEVLGRGGLKTAPLDLQKLKAMSVAEAARAIAKIDAVVGLSLSQQKRAGAEGAPASKPAPQPQPAPIPTVTSAGAAPSKDPSKMSMPEYVAHRQAQEAAAAQKPR